MKQSLKLFLIALLAISLVSCTGGIKGTKDTDTTVVVPKEQDGVAVTKITYFKFFFITAADKVLAGGAPEGKLATICDGTYKATIDAGILQMTEAFTTGKLGNDVFVGVNKDHAQLFYMVDATCNKDVKAQAKIYLDYLLSKSPYNIQEKNSPREVGPNGAQRAIFESPSLHPN